MTIRNEDVPMDEPTRLKRPDELSRRWTIYAFSVVTFAMAGSFMLYSLPAPFLAIYHERRSISSFWDGIIIGSASLGYLIASLLSGRLFAKYNFKPLLIIGSSGVAVMSIVNCVFNKIENVALYLAISTITRVFLGISTGLVATGSFNVLTKLMPNNVAFATSSAEAALNGAQAFGPFLGGVLWEKGGFSLAYWLPGLIVIAIVLLQITIPNVCTIPEREEKKDNKGIYRNPWILLAGWHCVAAQVLLYFHLPTMSLFAERALNETVVWTGLALLVNTSTIIISAPPLGYLIDKFDPYFFIKFSSLFLPFLYMLLGPVPFFYIATTKTQVMLVLAFLGIFVPMACTPTLLIMFEIYKISNGGEMSLSASNTIVSVWVSCFPLGAVIGNISAGVVSLFAEFEWATGAVGILWLIETVLSFVYCWRVNVWKRRIKEEEAGKATFAAGGDITFSNPSAGAVEVSGAVEISGAVEVSE